MLCVSFSRSPISSHPLQPPMIPGLIQRLPQIPLQLMLRLPLLILQLVPPKQLPPQLQSIELLILLLLQLELPHPLVRLCPLQLGLD